MYIEVIDMRNIFHRDAAREQSPFEIPPEEMKVHWMNRKDSLDEMRSSVFRHYDEWNIQWCYDLNPRCWR